MDHNLKALGRNLEVRITINGEWVESLPLNWEPNQVLTLDGWVEGLVIADGLYLLNQKLSNELAAFIAETITYWSNEDCGEPEHSFEMTREECLVWNCSSEDIKVAWKVQARGET